MDFNDVLQSYKAKGGKIKRAGVSQETKEVSLKDLAKLIKGDKGDRGDKGERGEPGPKGKDGAHGQSIVGPPGRDGKDGRDGKEGPAGKDGRDGKDGSTGGLNFLGKVWYVADTYRKGDVVLFNGSSVVAKKPSKGILPIYPSSEYWAFLAVAGQDGMSSSGGGSGGTSYTDEQAQDAIGAIVDGTLVYVDGTPLLTRAALTGDVTASQGSNATTIANDAVTYTKMQNVSAASKLLGRGSSGGSGDVEEITLGTGLTMTGTTLSSTATSGRTLLTGNVTYYVRAADGSDSNDGSANDAAHAWLTRKKAWEYVQKNLDLAGQYTVTINCTGTFTEDCTLHGEITGALGPESVVFQGNGGADKTTCVVNPSAANRSGFYALSGAGFTVQWMSIGATGSGALANGITAGGGSTIYFGNIKFTSCTRAQVDAGGSGAGVGSIANYELSGTSQYFSVVESNAFSAFVFEVTLTGTPVYTDVFALSDQNAVQLWTGSTFVGSATGSRYRCETGGGIDTGGGSDTFLPGSSPGIVKSGWYLGPVGQEIETLQGNRTYYVRTDGSDSNNGLADTASGAFLTIQKAINATGSLAIGANTVSIQVRNGTFTGTVRVSAPWLGTGTVELIGDTTTPSNVIISTTSADAVQVSSGGKLNIRGFKIQTTTSGRGIYALSGGTVTIDGKMDFGACASTQLAARYGGNITITASAYNITGAAPSHIDVFGAGASFVDDVATVTLSGTLNFSSAFAIAGGVSYLEDVATYSGGTITGQRYSVVLNAVINTGGGGANHFPGNSAGTTATGGQYA